MEATELQKFIYGKMIKFNLPTSTEIAKDIEEQAINYCCSRENIYSVLVQAGKKYEKDKNFDYYTFTIYGLVNKGKERSNRLKNDFQE